MPITTRSFDKNTVKKLDSVEFGEDWPVVYVLENGNEMYIGETVSASSRFKQHLENADRQKLTRAHLISDSEYNKSATLDIESWLIQYMVADEKFTLQNGNSGLSNHSYFDREKYRAKFEVIWQELQGMCLAQMTSNFALYFSLSK